MSHRLDGMQALGFDVFGTVVDQRNCIARQSMPFLERCGLRQIDPLTFADRWRGLYRPAIDACRRATRPYVPLDIFHREMVDDLLADLDLPDEVPGEADRAAFARAWERLDPWPGVEDGLRRLRNRFLLAPICNGSIAMMSRLARHARPPWDAVLGADISRTYKPQPQTYLAAAAALGLAPSQLAMVAAHNDDLHAAQAAGLCTIFVRRPLEHGRAQTTDLDADGV